MAIDPICGMSVDESTNLKLVFKGETYYFCNPRCLRRFAQENGIPMAPENNACLSCEAKGAPWYRNKIIIISGCIIALLLLSYAVPFLERFRVSFIMYFRMIWLAIFLGLVLGGVIDHFIPREYISKVLAKPKKRTIFYSVMLGFLMSACSHGILALSIQLYKKGASTPAVVSFLLASPWANMTLTVILVSFFGFKGFYIIGSAIVIAVITGLLFQILEKKALVETNPHSVMLDEDFSIAQDIQARYRAYHVTAANIIKDVRGVVDGTIGLANMVLWWILLGMTIASVSAAYVPQNIFQSYMGPTLLGLVVTLVVATVIEVCSEGSAPLAFEIYRQTGALGNSFVFLMAGVVTDYTEIGLLWSNIGRKTALWMPLITVPQVIVLGMLANYLF